MLHNIYHKPNTLILQITILLSVVLSGGCVDTMVLDSMDEMVGEDEIILTGSISMPGMVLASTRGEAKDSPGSDLQIKVLEFSKGSNAENSFLTNVYDAEVKTQTDVDNEELVTFNLKVKASSDFKVLHFFILSADSYLNIEMGSIASILPNLTVSEDDMGGGDMDFGDMERGDMLRGDMDGGDMGFMGGPIPYEAYWGFVELENGYSTTDSKGNVTKLDDIEKFLHNIHVIRNFAKISVNVDEEVKNFELLGFDLINVPTEGTIAPWDRANLSVPNLLDKDGKMLDYKKLSYTGIVPGSAGFRNTEYEVKNGYAEYSFNAKNPASKYIYEHPYESTRRTYLIVCGKYADDKKETYYKVDIGEADKTTGLFQNYNIIRNIHYVVNITGVNASGAETVSQAIDGPSVNNISTSTDTSLIPEMSDNQNLLILNKVRQVIVSKDEKVKILYRYLTGIDEGSGEEHNDPPYVDVIIAKGNVIKDWNIKDYTDNSHNPSVNWKEITIIPNEPTDKTQIQSFIITDKKGLGRVVTLILREPFEYQKLSDTGDIRATVAPGSSNNIPGDIDLENPVISSGIGEPLTVYFNLPDGMPEAMFPIQFQIESKYQWIENNKIGNLVVTTGQSLFNPSVTAISYLKTVSYMEYVHPYVGETNDLNPNEYNDNHTIRCRFLTIAEATGKAEIKIHNDYFIPDATVTFERK